MRRRLLVASMLMATTFSLTACATNEADDPPPTEPLSAEDALAEVGTDAMLRELIAEGALVIRLQASITDNHVLCSRTLGGELFDCCPVDDVEFGEHDVELDVFDEVIVRVRPRCRS